MLPLVARTCATSCCFSRAVVAPSCPNSSAGEVVLAHLVVFGSATWDVDRLRQRKPCQANDTAAIASPGRRRRQRCFERSAIRDCLKGERRDLRGYHRSDETSQPHRDSPSVRVRVDAVGRSDEAGTESGSGSSRTTATASAEMTGLPTPRNAVAQDSATMLATAATRRGRQQKLRRNREASPKLRNLPRWGGSRSSAPRVNAGSARSAEADVVHVRDTKMCRGPVNPDQFPTVVAGLAH